MPHWSGLLIIGVIVLLVFGGRGKISSIMGDMGKGCLLYTSPSPRDLSTSRMPSSA